MPTSTSGRASEECANCVNIIYSPHLGGMSLVNAARSAMLAGRPLLALISAAPSATSFLLIVMLTRYGASYLQDAG